MAFTPFKKGASPAKKPGFVDSEMPKGGKSKAPMKKPAPFKGGKKPGY